MMLARVILHPSLRWIAFLRGTPLAASLRSVSRNTLILLGGVLAVNALSVPFIAFLARSLGPEIFGTFSTVYALSSIAVMVFDFGAGKLITREIATHPSDSPSILGALLFPKLLLLPIVTCLFLLASMTFRFAPDERSAFGLSFIIAATMAATVAARAVFHAHHRMEFSVAGQLTERVVTIGLGVAMVQLDYGLAGVLLAYLIGSAAEMFLTWQIVRRHFVPSIAIPRYGEILTSMRLAFPLVATAIFTAIHLRAPVIMVEHLLGASAAGWYNAAFQILALALFFPQMLGVSIFPLFSKLVVEDKGAVNELCGRILLIPMVVGLACSVSLGYMADMIVVKLFSHEFDQATTVLRILVLALPFTFASTIAAQLLIASNQQNLVGVSTVVVTVVNVGLSLFLIPSIGITGAAAAAIIAEILLFVLYACHMHNTLLFVEDAIA